MPPSPFDNQPKAYLNSVYTGGKTVITGRCCWQQRFQKMGTFLLKQLQRDTAVKIAYVYGALHTGIIRLRNKISIKNFLYFQKKTLPMMLTIVFQCSLTCVNTTLWACLCKQLLSGYLAGQNLKSVWDNFSTLSQPVLLKNKFKKSAQVFSVNLCLSMQLRSAANRI